MTFIHKVEEDGEGNQLFTIASRNMEELDDIRWFLGADEKYDIKRCIIYFMTIGYDDMTKILTRFAELVSGDGDEDLPAALKWKEETLLPMNIWIDEAQTYLCRGHAKRVEFQLDTSDDLKPELVGWMDLDGNVHLNDPDASNLRDDELNRLRNFVRNNRSALEELADAKLRMKDVWGSIIKGGEPATDEQIRALNEKVAALVAARVAKAASAVENGAAGR